MPLVANPTDTIWDLPPLILHPFNERIPPSTLLENSQAALILSGLVPDEGKDHEELRRRLLAGRYSEIRMLFFLGRDIFRWIGQCLETATNTAELRNLDLKRQSFAGLLAAPPAAVRDKLILWGVSDYTSVFSRALGLNCVFAEPPEFHLLSEDFLKEYYRYADLMYRGFIEAEPHRISSAKNFRFELYASGEYAKLLESEWSEK